MSNRLIFYLKYSFKFFVLQKDIPLIIGLIITDRCNLSCKHCRVSNIGNQDLTGQQIIAKLKEFHKKGFRELYLEGGETYLWKDKNYTLDDLVDEAVRIGYYHVHIYTNGLYPLKSKADTLWVSVDGLDETYSQIRGDYFWEVIGNIKASNHPRIIIIYTINNINKEDIEKFLKYVRDEKLRVRGVMFYFHTPYYGIDELYIDFDSRKPIIDKIIRLKKSGLPVFNSYAALKALKTGKWKRPSAISAVSGIEGDYMCCRNMDDDTCSNCGYSACAELTEAKKLKPSAIINLMKFF